MGWRHIPIGMPLQRKLPVCFLHTCLILPAQEPLQPQGALDRILQVFRHLDPLCKQGIFANYSRVSRDGEDVWLMEEVIFFFNLGRESHPRSKGGVVGGLLVLEGQYM